LSGGAREDLGLQAIRERGRRKRISPYGDAVGGFQQLT
jgi:hypothetical protein